MRLIRCSPCVRTDSGGVCSLEKWRARKDPLNPFLVGGVMGAFNGVQRLEVHDGQTRRRVLSINSRVAMSSGLSSALLCTIFWYINQPSKKQLEAQQEAQAAAAAAAAAAQQQQVPVPARAGLPPLPPIEPLLGAATLTAGGGGGGAAELLTDGQTSIGADGPVSGLLPTSGRAQGLLPELLSGDVPDEPTGAGGGGSFADTSGGGDAPSKDVFVDPYAGKQQ